MPCFNAERHLPTSIASVVAQTLNDWELIAVDDGSLDGTLAYLQAQKDRRIRVIAQANQGVSAARNAALAHCQGDFVAFLYQAIFHNCRDKLFPYFFAVFFCDAFLRYFAVFHGSPPPLSI